MAVLTGMQNKTKGKDTQFNYSR